MLPRHARIRETGKTPAGAGVRAETGTIFLFSLLPVNCCIEQSESSKGLVCRSPSIEGRKRASMEALKVALYGLLALFVAWLLLAIVEALPALPAYHAHMGGH